MLFAPTDQVKRRLDEQYSNVKKVVQSLQQPIELKFQSISRHWRSVGEEARISILEEAWPDIGEIDEGMLPYSQTSSCSLTY